MATFDAPNRETCQVRRARTNTPLQALVLMNDVQYVEAARSFAENIVRDVEGDVNAKIKHAFRRVLARSPGDKELQSIVNLYNEYLSEFTADPESAKKLLANGESMRDENLNVSQVAAWTMAVSYTHLTLPTTPYV